MKDGSKRKQHGFGPLLDPNVRILVLGSFPSTRSREEGFYYAHKGNRFWKVMASVLDEEVPTTIEEKGHMLLKHHIGLYDAIESCQVEGSMDISIKDERGTDIKRLINGYPIKRIILNGKKAEEMFYRNNDAKELGVEVIALPSTSGANASWTLDRLIEEWGKYLKL